MAAGRIAERLADHDAHLTRINGSMERVADELAQVKLILQGLADAANADRSTVLTTASALKDADAARREKSDVRWSPYSRLLALVVALAAVAAAVIAWLALYPK
jgi:hypothetical protein